MEENKEQKRPQLEREVSQPSTIIAAFLIVAFLVGAAMLVVFLLLN